MPIGILTSVTNTSKNKKGCFNLKVLEYNIKGITSKVNHIDYDIDQVRFNINTEGLINVYKNIKFDKHKELKAFLAFSVSDGRININDASLHILTTDISYHEQCRHELIIPATLNAQEKIQILSLMY